MKTGRPRLSLMERVDKRSGCWLWTGPINISGYGSTGVRGLAHRAVYMELIGPIPKGMCLLHSCDVKLCCNPAHLRIGTPLDNSNDKRQRQGFYQWRKTQCKNGHLFTTTNTRIYMHQYRDGRVTAERVCRTCCRESARRRWRAANWMPARIKP